MSEENLRVVRGAIEAFDRKDFKAMAAATHDDFEFVSVFREVDRNEATYRGRNAWETYSAVMEETWEEWRLEDREYVEGEGDGVAVAVTLVGRGRHSGAVVERRVGIAYRIRDGKLWRARSYFDPDDALEAVGLRE